jgi:hypothetical protein
VKDSPLTQIKDQFSGMTAVAYNTTDAVILAKALTKFAKDVPAVQFKGALLNGQVVPATEIQNIANLPSREELVSKLLYLMQHPIRGLVTVLRRTSATWRWSSIRLRSRRGGEAAEAAPTKNEMARARRQRLNRTNTFGGRNGYFD